MPKDNVLDTSTADMARISELIQGDNLVEPQAWLEAANAWPKKGKFLNYQRPGMLDTIAGMAGITTDTTKQAQDIKALQAPWLQMLDTVNEQKRVRLMGPTQGEAATMPGGAKILGLQEPGPAGQPGEMLQPSATHPGAMQMFQPNAPLTPAQAPAFATMIQRDPLVTQRNALDLQIRDKELEYKAAEEKRKAELHPLVVSKAQDEGKIAHTKRVYEPSLLEGRLNMQKSLTGSREAAATDRERNVTSMIETRKKNLEMRGKDIEQRGKALEARVKDSGDLKTLQGALIRYKMAKDAFGRMDIGAEDADEIEAMILESANVITQLEQKTLGGVGIPDPGRPHRGAKTGPAVGTVKGGYKFKGGDPSKQESWEKAN